MEIKPMINVASHITRANMDFFIFFMKGDGTTG